MSGAAGQAFNTRAFVSLVLAATGVGLAPTGLADHLTEDSPAAWHNGWVLAHVAVGVLFAVFAVWHAVLNRRALLRRIRGASGGLKVLKISREAAWAAALVTVPFLLLMVHALAGE